MKREAHLHGVFQTYLVQPSPWNPEPGTQRVQTLDPVPVAGSFSDVTSKACSHSNFTGKCGESHCVQCHLNPVSKSKDKTKGTQKFRTSHELSGISATGVLDYLDSFNEEDEIYDHHANDPDGDYENGSTCVLVDDNDDYMARFWSLHDKQNDDNDNDEDDLSCMNL